MMAITLITVQSSHWVPKNSQSLYYIYKRSLARTGFSYLGIAHPQQGLHNDASLFFPSDSYYIVCQLLLLFYLISFTCAKLQSLFYYTKLLVLININNLICNPAR